MLWRITQVTLQPTLCLDNSAQTKAARSLSAHPSASSSFTRTYSFPFPSLAPLSPTSCVVVFTNSATFAKAIVGGGRAKRGGSAIKHLLHVERWSWGPRVIKRERRMPHVLISPSRPSPSLGTVHKFTPELDPIK